MAEEKNLEQIQYPEDMSKDEQEELSSFIDNGCPGIVRIKDSDIFQWFEFYMAGKSYSEIAIASKKKKEYILFMAKKQNWFQKKMDHYNDLLSNMSTKLKQTKVESMGTVSTIVSALGKYYNDKFNKYLLTKDESLIDSIDTKMLSQFYKSIDSLEKLMSNASDSDGKDRGPLVNFNLSGDATVKQIDSKTVEITDDTAGKMLKLLAASKKAKNQEGEE